jgi:hypothetical protein
MDSNLGFTKPRMNKRREDDIYDYDYALENSLKRLNESKLLSGRDKERARALSSWLLLPRWQQS